MDIPARTAKAKPDFPCRGTKIILETKGHFGGTKGRDKASAEARAKLLLLKAQYPDLDIRFVFQNAKTKIYKGSKTTNAMWAESNGFKWSDRGIIPQEWIKEIKSQQRKADVKLARTGACSRRKVKRRTVTRRRRAG